MRSIEVNFTKDLLDYLQSIGYTHIISHGTGYKEEKAETDDYLLEPLKPGDIRLKAEETSYHIDLISDIDVKEMAAGDEFITFLITLPVKVYEEFLKVS